MRDLATELRDYIDTFDEPFEPAALIEKAEDVIAVPQKRALSVRRGVVIGFAAAIAMLVLLGGTVLLLGGDEAPMVTQPSPESWTTYTEADGLIGNCGCDMAVTPDGTVWLISPEGIFRFDGVAWSRLPAPQEFYRGGDLSATAAHNSALWFTGGGTAARYDNDEWTIFTPETIVTPEGTVTSGSIYDVVVSGDGTFWAVEESAWYVAKLVDGSFIRVDEQFKPLAQIEGSYEENTGIFNATIAIGSDGRLWVSGGPGGDVHRLYELDGSTVAIHPSPGTFTPELLAIAPDGSVWLAAEFDMNGTDGRLLRFDGVSWTTFPLGGVIDAAFEPDGTGWFVIDAIPEDDLWVRPQYSAPGAYRFDGETWTRFTMADGLAGHDLKSVEVGDDGSVWFGTYAHGVTRYQPGTDSDVGTPITLRGDPLLASEWPASPTTTTPR